jgi:hypothetical protein
MTTAISKVYFARYGKTLEDELLYFKEGSQVQENATGVVRVSQQLGDAVRSVSNAVQSALNINSVDEFEAIVLRLGTALPHPPTHPPTHTHRRTLRVWEPQPCRRKLSIRAPLTPLLPTPCAFSHCLIR